MDTPPYPSFLPEEWTIKVFSVLQTPPKSQAGFQNPPPSSLQNPVHPYIQRINQRTYNTKLVLSTEHRQLSKSE